MKRSALASVWMCVAAVSAAHGAIFVDSVISGSPAEAAGMQAGDRLLRLDGQPIATPDDLERVTSAHQPGDTVPMTVQRNQKAEELKLTFGERPDGGVSIGVRLRIEMTEEEVPTEATAGTVECLEWIDKTYKISSTMQSLDLELADDYEAIRTCVEHDTQRMSSEKAVKYCDNIFKVHCSANDLLTELGEALVGVCEQGLGEAKQGKAWKTCAQHEIFDRYVQTGQSSDLAACKAALDGCGANQD